MPIIALAIGAGLGAVKHVAVDQPAYGRQKKLAAETQRFSPWTGLKSEAPQEPNMLGSMMQFGATGASLGANIQSQQAQNKLLDAQTKWFNSPKSSGNSWAAMRSAQPAFSSVPNTGPVAGGMGYLPDGSILKKNYYGW